LIEEKTMENEMDRKPLQCACRSLNEGSKGMLPPPKSVPILRGPSKHTNKHKPKWYVKACLVCFHAKKKGHDVDVRWHFSLCSFDGKNGKKLSQDNCKFKVTQIRRECQATLALARIFARTTTSRNQGFIRNFIPSTTHQKKVWRVKSKG
jgi:hypothetical protein